jgi:hypothetical protein
MAQRHRGQWLQANSIEDTDRVLGAKGPRNARRRRAGYGAGTAIALEMSEAAAQPALDALPDGELARLQELDRVLQQEAHGILEIIVYRPAEMPVWHRAAAESDEVARRLTVLREQLPRFLAAIDDQRCCGCGMPFCCEATLADLVLAHARVATVLPTVAAVGGVCARCSAAHDAVELRALFAARLRIYYPDLSVIEPAATSAETGSA